jgi:signal peptide peptidase SppA
MQYEHVTNAVFNEPWAIQVSKMAIIMDLVAFKANGGILTEEEIQDRIGAATPRRESRNGAVAVIPLFGVIAQRMNMMSAMSGGTSTELFGKAFKDAVADPSIGGIVLDIDSPGGSVFGVQELWQTIMDARGEKPIVAVANSMAASAAYWIATAADEIVVTPGGEVGSIGVITAHNDLSAALELSGEKVTLISAGKKKVDGNPFEPLSDQAKADLQARVDTYYTSFVSSVAKARGTTASAVRSGFGEGGMVGAVEAVKLGMADRVGTLETGIQRVGGKSTLKAEELSKIIAKTVTKAAMTGGFGGVIKGGQLTEADVNGEWQGSENLEPDDGDLDRRQRRLALHELTRP